ncbi:hypothetical protein C0J52_27439 [Blattella germanica]|nr:hypothetical protein C0J52_27439 [Blattella germanica]
MFLVCLNFNLKQPTLNGTWKDVRIQEVENGRKKSLCWSTSECATYSFKERDGSKERNRKCKEEKLQCSNIVFSVFEMGEKLRVYPIEMCEECVLRGMADSEGGSEQDDVSFLRTKSTSLDTEEEGQDSTEKEPFVRCAIFL